VARAADFFIVLQENGDHQTARAELGLTWRVEPVRSGTTEGDEWEVKVQMEGYFTGTEEAYEVTMGMFRGLMADTEVDGVEEEHEVMSELFRHGLGGRSGDCLALAADTINPVYKKKRAVRAVT